MKYSYLLYSSFTDSRIILGEILVKNPSIDADDAFEMFVYGEKVVFSKLSFILEVVEVFRYRIIAIDQTQNIHILLDYDEENRIFYGRESTIKIFGLYFIPAS